MSDDRVDRRNFVRLVGALGLGGLASETVTATPGRTPEAGRDEFLVGVEPTAAMGDVESDAVSTASFDTQVTHRNEALEYFAIELPEQASDRAREAVEEALSNRPGVDYVEDNPTVHTMESPNDPRFDSQYAPQQVNALAAWDTTTGSADVTIAVVDTGADYDHEDLNGPYARDPGYDFVDSDGDPYPNAGAEHGTHVSGCASADTNNDVGTAGISDSTLINCRCLGGGGSGSLSAIADGIQYAADQGADIINMSLGGGGYNQTMKNAVQYAADRDCLIICAAGNDGNSSVSYPAQYEECVAVTAIDPNEDLAYFSNYGSSAEVAAPGVNVLAPVPGNGYSELSGTSMASPVAAGVAALGAAAYPGLSASELRNRLKNTADDVGLPRDQQGAGRVDAAGIVDGGGGDDPDDPGDDPDDGERTIGDGTYRIVNVNSGKVIDVQGVSTDRGADVHQWTWNGTDNQKWQVTHQGNGAYELKAVHSGKVADGNASSENNVHQWDPNGGDSQRWFVDDVDGDGYRIREKATGDVMDVNGAGTSDGDSIITYDWHGGTNQRFRFEPVDGGDDPGDDPDDPGTGDLELTRFDVSKDDSGFGFARAVVDWGASAGSSALETVTVATLSNSYGDQYTRWDETVVDVGGDAASDTAELDLSSFGDNRVYIRVEDANGNVVEDTQNP